MLALEWLAERKIEEAVSRGELDCLPGSGRPLSLEEDPLVPEDLRMACRILRNAGFAEADLTREVAGKWLAQHRARIDRSYYGKVVAKLVR
jgi:hypothetical protein